MGSFFTVTKKKKNLFFLVTIEVLYFFLEIAVKKVFAVTRMYPLFVNTVPKPTQVD